MFTSQPDSGVVSLGEVRGFLWNLILSEAFHITLLSLKATLVTSQCKGQRVQLWKEELASGRVWSPAEKKKEIPNFTSFRCQLNIFWCRNLSGGTRWIPVKWQFRQSVSGWKGCIDWSPTGPSDISSQKRAINLQIYHGVHCRPVASQASPLTSGWRHRIALSRGWPLWGASEALTCGFLLCMKEEALELVFSTWCVWSQNAQFTSQQWGIKEKENTSALEGLFFFLSLLNRKQKKSQDKSLITAGMPPGTQGLVFWRT